MKNANKTVIFCDIGYSQRQQAADNISQRCDNVSQIGSNGCTEAV